jgi:SH3-like domain-containing protein
MSRTFIPAFALLLLLTVPALLPAQELCVKVARANLRAGPGSEAKKTWEVYENMPFMQLERRGDWLRVRDVDGDEHWVYRTLVDTGSHCVTIKAERANVRKGPGTNFDTWFIVEKYTSFKKVGSEGSWIKVEYEGETMWLFANLVWP